MGARGYTLRLFSYVVARDYGFAPNPFFGVCTLATCKPIIRRVASIGDWVIGTGSKSQDKRGHLVYGMQVTEIMTFDEYWNDERFHRKRPNLRGSKKQAFGDNIYFKDDIGKWNQQDSHHSLKDGSPNGENIKHDTKTNRILLSTDFVYWGGSGPEIPSRFRSYDGVDVCCARTGHKSRFPEDMINDFVDWFHSLDVSGYLGEPLDWSKTP